MKRAIWFGLVVLLLMVLLVACTKSAPAPAPTTQAPASSSVAATTAAPAKTTSAPAPSTTSAPAPVGQPQYGGTLKLSAASGPVELGNSPTMTGRNYFYIMPALEMFIEQDAQGRPLPKLATEWQTDPNGKFTIFKLRQGVKFHDGTDWNAQAAKANLDAILAGPTIELPGVKSVEVVDQYTVKLVTDYYSDVVLSNLTVPISSPTHLAKGVDATKLVPVGTGPFKFVEFKRDAYIKYTKFDGYYEKGKPYLDAIEIHFIPEAMTASAAFQKGETQWIDRPTTAVALDLKAKGYPSTTLVATENGLVPDTNNPNSVFANSKVREAIEYAIDRKQIAETVGKGFLIPREQFAGEGRPGYVPGMARAYDPAKAKQLLKEAGYANGFETTIIFPPPPFADQNAMTAVQSYLAAVGIKAKLERTDNARWTELRYNSGWKDALIYMQSGAFASMSRSFTMTLSASRHDYFSMARPAGCEDLLKQIQSSQDFNAQKALMEKMSKSLFDNATFVPLYFTVESAYTQKNVHDTGRYDVRQQLTQWSPQNAWISK